MEAARKLEPVRASHKAISHTNHPSEIHISRLHSLADLPELNIPRTWSFPRADKFVSILN
mgnify:FL=1|jgi:hypothetical protein